MQSPHALLFLAIQQQLLSILDNDDNPLLRFVAMDFGQLEDYVPPGKPPVSYPCALISIDDADYTSEGMNTQRGVISVVIRIGFDPYSATSNLTPDVSRNKALAYFELEQKIYLAFQGWAPGTVTVTASPSVTTDLSNDFGHFMRRKAFTERRKDFLHVRVIQFSITHQDYTAKEPITYTGADPNITYEILEPL